MSGIAAGLRSLLSIRLSYTVKIIKFSIADFFGKFDQIRSFLLIGLHLLKISVMQNFIFRAVLCTWVTRWKKLMKTGILLKMEIYCEDDTFHADKPGNWRSHFYCKSVSLNLIEEERKCQKSVAVTFYILSMSDMENALKLLG